jgi:2-dehydropantoate 2-reductase
MRILIYGAGVIGSIFAYKLKNARNDVTILARGKRLEQIKSNGILLRDEINDKDFQINIDTIDTLKPEDYYDLVVIIMQRHQITDVLSILQKNSKIPTYLFVGNNVNGAEEYLNFLDKSRILLGFGGTGGYREDGLVIGAYIDHTILYVGELSGEISTRLNQIKDVFEKSDIIVEFSDNIDAWLKSHAALISALAMASYSARNRDNKLGNEDELITLAIKTFRENLDALAKLEIPILPKNFKLMKYIPIFFLRKKLKNLLNSDFGRIALSGHADHAKTEMIRLIEDFRGLIKKVKEDWKYNNQLYELFAKKS